MTPKCRVVVLIGGNGSNLQALIDNQDLRLKIELVGVISHRQEAYGLTRAQTAHIATSVVPHTDYATRTLFEEDLQRAIDNYQPDLILLAGFMRILSPDFVKHYEGKLLNIHPSLLPKYKGLHTHQRVLDAKESEHGVSVHFVTAELDGGPIVAQVSIAISPNDTAETLAKRLFVAEHWLYGEVVKWFAENRLKYDQNVVTLDDKRLAPQGQQLSLPTMQGIVS